MKVLGINEYGLYQLIFSVAQYVFVLDFGITAVLARYISEYRAKLDLESEKNIAFHIFVFVIIINCIIVALGVVLMSQISSIFPSLTETQTETAENLFLWMIVQIVLTLFCHYFDGISMGYERFSMVKIVALARVIMKTLLVYTFLLLTPNVMGIVYADVLAMAVGCVFMIWYVYAKTEFKMHFLFFDKPTTKQIVLLSFAMLIRSVITYVNNALDKTLLGIYCETQDVTIYTVAMTFISIFGAAPTVIQNLYIPSATRLVVNNASPEAFTDLVVRPGRYQFIFCGGFLGGFFIFGKQFITLWTGAETIGAWFMALIIMIPMMIPLIQNVCLSILTAKNKRMGYSVILLIMTVINIPLSIWLIKTIGPKGAALGTAIAYLFGNCIAVNIYYIKVIKLDIIRIFRSIFKGIFYCVVITTVAVAPINFLPLDGAVGFIAKCLIYCIVYAVLLWFIGLNCDEKTLIKDKIKTLRSSISG